MEWHFSRNLNFLKDPAHYFVFAYLYKGMLMPFRLKILWPHGLNLPLFSVVIALVIYHWRAKPLFLRKATIYFIILFLLAMTYGYINELRAYYDALPIVYLLAAMGGYKLYGKLKKIFAKGYSHG